ncbi:unnamed protein product, partial [Porites lobata]
LNCVSTSVAYLDGILTLKTSTTTSQRAQRVQISRYIRSISPVGRSLSRCYIQPIFEEEPQQQDDEDFEDPLQLQFGDDDDDEEKKGPPPPPPTLNFAHIECALTKDQAVEPNLIYWSSEEDEDIHHATTINEFLDACEAMTEVEDDVRPRKVITFFHNLRGFDGNFLLKALYDQGRAVEKPLTQGAKILSFECGNLIFKDSLNFFAMPLERFPSTFI